jgi:hypothetical protein
MKNIDKEDQSASENGTTGLPWPKTWNGAYLFVMGSFILWLVLLIALTEYGS